MFFGLSSFLLALLLFVAVFGSTVVALRVGRSQRHRSEHLREPFAALQAALLGYRRARSADACDVGARKAPTIHSSGKTM